MSTEFDAKDITDRIGDTLLTCSRALTGYADTLKKLRTKDNSLKITQLIGLMLNKSIEFQDLAEEVGDYYNELVNAQVEDLSANGIEDWKDLVISTLPEGASMAMANDVEEALEQFKNVY